MEERTIGQKLLVEFVGTFTLIFVAAGSIIAAPFGGGALITIGIAYGFAMAAMVSAVGHVSGGHLNPAVTIGAWVTQRMEASTAVQYIVAQVAGGAAAAGVLRAAVPESFWRNANLGTPGLNTALSTGQGVLIEAVLTFFLVWVVFGAVIDGAFKKTAGLVIGSVVTMGVLMGFPLTGAAMNPARWLGPALVGGFWANWWVWVVGPVAGGIVAAVLYDTVILRPRETPSAAAGAATGPQPEGSSGAVEVDTD